MAITTTRRLHAEIIAVCPILGVSVGTYGFPASVRIDFDPVASAPQRVAAQAVVDSFDWSDAAQLAWENTRARTQAIALLATPEGAYKLDRAIVMLTVDEINSLRSWITSFKAEVAAATSLADLKTRVAALPNVPARTLAQARTAIISTINAGTVDT